MEKKEKGHEDRDREREMEMEKKEKGHEDRWIERERWRRRKRDMKIDR